MAAQYPSAIKTFSSIVNGVTKLVASLFNSPYEEITAIQTELGTDPAGLHSDLKTRISGYDSGWFAVAADTTYTKTHNLGTTKVICCVYASTDDAGSGNCFMVGSNQYSSSYTDQCSIVALTTTQVQIRTTSSMFAAKNYTGAEVRPTSGYARVVILPLE